MFFRAFQHLLPHARAWRLTIDKALRRLFEGLAGIGEDAKAFLDTAWRDIFPIATREISAWEKQFGIPGTGLNEPDRRTRLAAAWAATGGQSPRYIQDTLQAAGFDVYVHEWWVPGSEPAPGVPGTGVARNPFLYLDDGSATSYASCDGAADMQDGRLNGGGPPSIVCADGTKNSPAGYPLVNIIYEPVAKLLGDGSEDMQDGGDQAMDGAVLAYYSRKQYAMPADASKYPYFLYIAGEVFPNVATVDQSRRNEFEKLCLKVCPAQQWLGMLIVYS